jgi:hypothetical protein
MTDILDKIDAAVGCHHCHGLLGASPSDDFCSENCQNAWRAERVGAPAIGLFQTVSPARVYIRPELARWQNAMEGLTQAMAGLGAAWHSIDGVVGDISWEWDDDEPQSLQEQTAEMLGVRRPNRQRAMQAALEELRNRNTGPSQRRRNGRIL